MIVKKLRGLYYESSWHLEISSILEVKCASGVCDQYARKKPLEKTPFRSMLVLVLICSTCFVLISFEARAVFYSQWQQHCDYILIPFVRLLPRVQPQLFLAGKCIAVSPSHSKMQECSLAGRAWRHFTNLIHNSSSVAGVLRVETLPSDKIQLDFLFTWLWSLWGFSLYWEPRDSNLAKPWLWRLFLFICSWSILAIVIPPFKNKTKTTLEHAVQRVLDTLTKSFQYQPVEWKNSKRLILICFQSLDI